MPGVFDPVQRFNKTPFAELLVRTWPANGQGQAFAVVGAVYTIAHIWQGLIMRG